MDRTRATRNHTKARKNPTNMTTSSTNVCPWQSESASCWRSSSF